MLFKADILGKIAQGDVTLAFRRWTRPSVKVGTRLHTPCGVVEILSLTSCTEEALTTDDAVRAGYRDLAALRKDLARRSTGELVRIAFRYAGADPRRALAQESALSEGDAEAIAKRLDALDSRSRRGPWTRRALALVAQSPGVPARRLAEETGCAMPLFKTDMRKLGALGLTTSLAVGYRLSARGEAFLARDQR
ncbi:hypothetical protein [Chelatococcus sp. GW1]|uniref:hypothetical protein n=1 Tax=Chelatococcus sp. GW1 TaxID=1211115 RepID=UPI00031E6130|nr:hypothetical protein [Chelatococcus sp. GW1]ALA16332.1 hypothetical protein AL346_01570 [Chelatococcus sp. CO-6]